MKKMGLGLFIGLSAMVGCKKYEYDTEQTMQTKKSRLVNEWSPYAYFENGMEKTTYARFDLTVLGGRSQKANIDYGIGPLYQYNGVDWKFMNHGNELEFNLGDAGIRDYEILRLEKDTLWLRTINSSEQLEYHFASR